MSLSNSLLLLHMLPRAYNIVCKFKVQVQCLRLLCKLSTAHMHYIIKSNFWLSMLLSSHLVHCKQFPKTIFVNFNLSAKTLTMKLINFSHCLPCTVIFKNISLICLRSLQLEGHYNDKRNWTLYTSEFKYHHHTFKFGFQFVLLSSYNQSR